MRKVIAPHGINTVLLKYSVLLIHAWGRCTRSADLVYCGKTGQILTKQDPQKSNLTFTLLPARLSAFRPLPHSYGLNGFLRCFPVYSWTAAKKTRSTRLEGKHVAATTISLRRGPGTEPITDGTSQAAAHNVSGLVPPDLSKVQHPQRVRLQ